MMQTLIKKNYNRKETNTKIYNDWRCQVLDKFDHQCKKCFSKENLHCHHIKSWEEYPELRFEVSNGEVYCASCHLRYERQINPIRFWKGKKFSEIHKQRLRLSHLGKIPANKGIPVSDELKKRISKTKKSQSPVIPEFLECSSCHEVKKTEKKNFVFINGRPLHKCRNCKNRIRRNRRGNI